MLNKMSRRIGHYKFISSFLILSLLLMSGCKFGQFGGQPTASIAEVQMQPPAPVVVDGVRTSYADVVQKTSPAVVRIEAEVKSRQSAQQPQQFGLDDFFNFPQQPQNRGQQPPTQRGLGSGVIVSADGTVLTNNHVVEGAEKITVLMSDDKTYEARIVGLDEPSDLAVLKIEATNLPFLNLGNSDNVRVGDVVLAIGNPLGIGQTVTAGIISAKGRRTGLSDGNSFEDFLQTDAPINRGNSGGALINIAGELIGINSQILSTGGAQGGGSIGIGFAIPTNMAKGVLEQLIATGRVRRGLLGVGIQAVNEEIKEFFKLKDTKGVLINDVKRGGAAEKAGVKRDDVIVAINGETIDDTNVLRNKVAGTQPGTEIRLRIVRDGQEQELPVVLDELNPENAKTAQPNESDRGAQTPNEGGKLGLNLQPLTPLIARQLELPESSGGVVITDVDPNGAAAKVGAARGDVILTINRQAVGSLDEVQAALDKAGDRPILLLIARKGQTVYLTVRPS
jgi:Do/DeqQ family serine protease